MYICLTHLWLDESRYQYLRVSTCDAETYGLNIRPLSSLLLLSLWPESGRCCAGSLKPIAFTVLLWPSSLPLSLLSLLPLQASYRSDISTSHFTSKLLSRTHHTAFLHTQSNPSSPVKNGPNNPLPSHNHRLPHLLSPRTLPRSSHPSSSSATRETKYQMFCRQRMFCIHRSILDRRPARGNETIDSRNQGQQ